SPSPVIEQTHLMLFPEIGKISPQRFQLYRPVLAGNDHTLKPLHVPDTVKNSFLDHTFQVISGYSQRPALLKVSLEMRPAPIVTVATSFHVLVPKHLPTRPAETDVPQRRALTFLVFEIGRASGSERV